MKNALFLLSLLLIGSCTPQISEVVTIETGQIKGSLIEDTDVLTFKGIPFAAPPVAENRWKPPLSVDPWEDVRQCTSFSASPVQDPPRPFMFWSEEFLIPGEPISEDCLYLNVWTKAETTASRLPVLVYIYGGGFRSGGSACPIYDGTAMAKEGVVFVSFNYRVGPFGFFAHPELTEESARNASGNYALMDMIAALKWVQANIEQFGGDPGNVTIAGQSAGAFAVNYLVASPQAKGLFHKAIAQSGGHFYARPGRPFLSLENAEKQGLAFADSLGCKSLDELRQRSAKEIQKIRWYQSGPIVDGYIVPETVYETFTKGNQNDVPTILGWNKDDIVFVSPMPATEFPEYLQQQFGDYASEFSSSYPHKDDETTLQSLKDMNRDEMFASQGYAWAKQQGSTGRSDVFVYNFNRALPANNPETQFGAFHSGEIVYWYDNLHTLDRPWETIDHTISAIMSDYLLNFLSTGDPNGEDLPIWNSFDKEEAFVLTIDKETKSQVLPTKHKLEVWESFFTQNQK